MASIDYILIYALLYGVFFAHSISFFGKNNDKNSRFIFSFFVMCFFSAVEAVRYNRGEDYSSYRFRYECINVAYEQSQIVYLKIMQFFDFLGFSFPQYLFCLSFFLIFALFYTTKFFFPNKMSAWMLFLIPFAILGKSECLIRQYTALPFVWLSFVCVAKKKWFAVFILQILAYNTHSMTVLLIVPFLICYFLKDKIIPLKFSLAFSFISYFILPERFVSELLLPMISNISLGRGNLDSRFGSYVENSDRWFGADSYLDAYSQQSFFGLFSEFLFLAGIIVAGYKSIKLNPNKYISIFYNFSIVGIILNRFFYGSELMIRFAGLVSIWWFVPVGYAFYVYNANSIERKGKDRGYQIAVYGLVIYLITYYGRYLLYAPAGYLFIWS